MRQRAAVDEFEFAAERHAVREPRCAYFGTKRDLREQVRGSFSLDRRIRRDDQLAKLPLAQSCCELVEAKFLGPGTVKRRQTPEQDEVQTAVSGRLLDRKLIYG